jgi:hypothetical protein
MTNPPVHMPLFAYGSISVGAIMPQGIHSGKLAAGLPRHGFFR